MRNLTSRSLILSGEKLSLTEVGVLCSRFGPLEALVPEPAPMRGRVVSTDKRS